MAASRGPIGIEPTSPPFVVGNCATLPAGTVTFQVARPGPPLTPQVGALVTVTLPVGLTFADGTTTKNLVTDSTGTVTLPAITVSGAAGSYAIKALIAGPPAVEAVSLGTVVSNPAPAVEFNFGAFTTAGLTPTTSPVGVTGVDASTSGTDETSIGAIIDSTGRVQLWRNSPPTGFSGTPAALTYNGSTLTGMTMVSTWTSAADTTSGGLTSDGTNVYRWLTSTGGTTTSAQVTGITGTVLGVSSNWRVSYIYTTTGIFSVQSSAAASGTPATIAAPTGTSERVLQTGITNMTSYNAHILTDAGEVGGAAVVNGALYTWGGADTSGTTSAFLNTFAPVAALAGKTIFEAVATEAGYVVLTTDGEVWTQGAAFSTSAWTLRATGVSDITAWGVHEPTSNTDYYLGGLYVKDGQMYQFSATAFTANDVNFAYEARPVTGTSGKTIVSIDSSDATYLAVASDGTAYAWTRNLPGWDSIGTPNPVASPLSVVGPVSVMNVWGYHIPTSTFRGGGVVIPLVGC